MSSSDSHSPPSADGRTPLHGAFAGAGALSLLVPLVLGLLLSWHSLSDADIWIHDRIGRDVLTGQGAPENNDFTFAAPDHDWTNHELLFQLMVASLGPGQPAAGENAAEITPQSWNLLRSGLVLLLLLVLLGGDGRLRRIRNRVSWNAGWWGIPWLMGLAMLWPRLILRPELLSYLFFVLAIRKVAQAQDELRNSPTPLVPSPSIRQLLDPRRAEGSVFWLTLVWAWSHGFAALVPALWILGGVLTWLQGLLPGRVRTGRTDGIRRWWMVLGLSILALALTPNGIGGLIYPLRALGQFGQESVDLRRVISELVPLLETRNSLHWTLLVFRASMVWSILYIVLTWGRVRWLRIAIWCLALAGALFSQRNIGFYAIAFCLLHTDLISATPSGASRLVGRVSEKLSPSLRIALAGLGLLLTVVVGLGWGQQLISDQFYLREGVGRRFGTGFTPSQTPLGALPVVGLSPTDRVFTNLNGAALLLDRTDARLFIDGRTEAHPATDWARYRAILRGGENALQQLQGLGVQQVLLSGGGTSILSLVTSLGDSPRWALKWVDESGFLYLANSSPHPAELDSVVIRANVVDLEAQLIETGEDMPSARFADRCLAIARLWRQAGISSRQESILRRGLNRRPGHPTLLHNLGNLQLAQGDFAAAEESFADALKMNPRLAGSALNLGVALMSQNQLNAASSAFEQAVGINEELFEAWVNWGMVLERLGQPRESRKALERALELRPQDQRLKRYLAGQRR